MSDTRRLQLGLLLSLLVNSVALLLVGRFWQFHPIPEAEPLSHIKLVKVALNPPPVIKPILIVRPVPKPLPRPHRIKPQRLHRRRPGARVKTSSPAPPAKQAGGSDTGAAAPALAAPSPPEVLTTNRDTPLLAPAHRTPPLIEPQLAAGDATLPAPPQAVPSTQTGKGASGADAAGKGQGAGEGAGSGSGSGSGSSTDAGEPFGVGRGMAGDGGPRHVVYVLDISRSMTSRIARADSELRRALSGLRPDETFDIIAFNDQIYPFDTGMEPATPNLVRQASVFLGTLQVGDGTDLEAAMTAALSLPDINEVILLTDGVPTDGETDFGKLARLIRRRNKTHARISTVGLVGKNPDGTDDTFEATRLLQQVAADSGGASKLVPLGVASP